MPRLALSMILLMTVANVVQSNVWDDQDQQDTLSNVQQDQVVRVPLKFAGSEGDCQTKAAMFEKLNCIGGVVCLSSEHMGLVAMGVAFSILFLVFITSFLSVYCTSNKSCIEVCGCCGPRGGENRPQAHASPRGASLEEVVTEGHQSGSRQHLRVFGSSEKKRKRESVSSVSDYSESGQYVRQSPSFRTGEYGTESEGDEKSPGKSSAGGNATSDRSTTSGNLITLSPSGDQSVADVTTADQSGANSTAENLLVIDTPGSRNATADDTNATLDSTANDSTRLIQDD